MAANLVGAESRFAAASHPDLSILSGFSNFAGLQVVTQSTHHLKDCYPRLVLNQHRSERLHIDGFQMQVTTPSNINFGSE